jgi:hypothetical protein
MEKVESPLKSMLVWLPHVAVFLGLLIGWLVSGIVGILLMQAGFAVYGLLGIWTSIKRKYYDGLSLRFLKLSVQIAIVALAIIPFFFVVGFFPILMMMVLDNVFLTTQRVELASETN